MSLRAIIFGQRSRLHLLLHAVFIYPGLTASTPSQRAFVGDEFKEITTSLFLTKLDYNTLSHNTLSKTPLSPRSSFQLASS